MCILNIITSRVTRPALDDVNNRPRVGPQGVSKLTQGSPGAPPHRPMIFCAAWARAAVCYRPRRGQDSRIAVSSSIRILSTSLTSNSRPFVRLQAGHLSRPTFTRPPRYLARSRDISLQFVRSTAESPPANLIIFAAVLLYPSISIRT